MNNELYQQLLWSANHIYHNNYNQAGDYNDFVRVYFAKFSKDKISPESISRCLRKMAEEGILKKIYNGNRVSFLPATPIALEKIDNLLKVSAT